MIKLFLFICVIKIKIFSLLWIGLIGLFVVSSATLMLQLDGFPTGDGVKVKVQFYSICYSNISHVCSAVSQQPHTVKNTAAGYIFLKLYSCQLIYPLETPGGTIQKGCTLATVLTLLQ